MRFVIEAVGLTAGGGKDLAVNFFSRLRLFHDHEFVLFLPDLPEYSALTGPNVKCIRYSGRGNLFSRYWALQRILPRICEQYRADALLCLGNFAPGSSPCPIALLVQNAYLGYCEPVAEQRLTLREKLIVAYSRSASQRLRRRRIHIVVQTPVMRERMLSSHVQAGPPQRNHVASSLRPISTRTARASVISAGGSASTRRPQRSSVFSVLMSDGRGDSGFDCRHQTTAFEEPSIVPNPSDYSGDSMPLSRQADSRQPFTFLCLARYYAHKNLEILPPALKQLSSYAAQPFKCIITIAAGQHPNAGRLVRRIEQEGLRSVLLNIGPVPRDKLAETYRSADALILPTLLESYTRTYSEAMRYGLPIITSDRDFARYLCKEAAMYFDPLDPLSVAKSMASIMADHDLRRKLVANGQRIISELPSWDAVAAQFVAVLERMAEGNRE
jgi:glycosyltransferase involved in cell wall biosynthesis